MAAFCLELRRSDLSTTRCQDSSPFLSRLGKLCVPWFLHNECRDGLRPPHVTRRGQLQQESPPPGQTETVWPNVPGARSLDLPRLRLASGAGPGCGFAPDLGVCPPPQHPPVQGPPPLLPTPPCGTLLSSKSGLSGSESLLLLLLPPLSERELLWEGEPISEGGGVNIMSIISGLMPSMGVSTLPPAPHVDTRSFRDSRGQKGVRQGGVYSSPAQARGRASAKGQCPPWILGQVGGVGPILTPGSTGSDQSRGQGGEWLYAD